MTIVTVSASYGAGGALVGPKLAERLEVPFLDRAIPSEVAERLAIPMEEAAARDDSIGGLLSRVAMRLAPIGLAFGAEAAEDALDEESYRRTTEAIIREHAAERRRRRCSAARARWCCATTRARCTCGSTARARSASSRPMRLGDGETRRGRDSGWTRPTAPARPTSATSTAPTPRDAGLYHLTIDSTGDPAGSRSST